MSYMRIQTMEDAFYLTLIIGIIPTLISTYISFKLGKENGGGFRSFGIVAVILAILYSFGDKK